MTSMHRKTRRIRTLLLNTGTLSLFVTSFSSVVRAQDARDTTPRAHNQIRVGAKTEASLFIVTFKTPQGQIHIFLPEDMRPGDAIIGSTSLEPKGRQEADKETNRAQLSAYSLSLAGQSHPLQEAVPQWNLPADLKAADAVLTLTDSSQQEAARAEVPLTEQESRTAGNASLGKDQTRLPTKGQVGRPLVIRQAFGPGAEMLHVFIGDKEARLLAASPRVTVVESPRDVVGKTKLQVKRGSELLAEGNFRNNRVSSGNPWPYVIGAVVIAGIVIAVSAANDLHNLSHLGPLGPVF